MDTGQIKVSLGDIGLNDLGRTTTATFNNGAWHHVVWTYDGSSNQSGITIYVDRVAQATTQSGSQTSITGTITNTDPVRFGANSASTPVNFFTGAMHNIRFYRRVLTALEVAELSNPDTMPLSEMELPATLGSATRMWIRVQMQ